LQSLCILRNKHDSEKQKNFENFFFFFNFLEENLKKQDKDFDFDLNKKFIDNKEKEHKILLKFVLSFVPL